MKKTTGIIIAVLVVGAIVALLAVNKKKMTEEAASTIELESAVSVSTITLENQTYNLDFSASGTVQAVNELNFVSSVQGRVIAIYADKGRYVHKGDALLKIDSELLESDYNASLAAYEAMEQDVRRFTASNEAGGVTDQQLESMKTQLVAAKSRLDRSRKMLDDAIVKAPISGMINSRYVELGSLLAPNVPLFDIVNDGQLKIQVSVPESKVNMLVKGQVVDFTCSSAPGKTFSGKISFIGVKTDRGLNYPVEITLDRDKDLHIGMYLKAQFSQNAQRTGVLVPRKAIVGSAKAANVFVVKDNKARQREVTLGDMVGDQVEVLDGVSAGEEIITAGIMNVADGSDVVRVN